MIVGCYTLDLYCKNYPEPWVKSDRHDYKEHFPTAYTGHTLAECKRDARRDGWRFTRDGDCICPICTQQARKAVGDE